MRQSDREKSGIASAEQADSAAGRRESATLVELTPLLKLAWFCGWAAILAAAWWMHRLTPWPLAIAAALSIVWTIGAVQVRQRQMLAASLVLWSTLGIAAAVEYQLLRITNDWPSIKAQVEERASGELREALDDLVDRGARAVIGASVAYTSADTTQSDPRLFSQLAALRGATEVSAIALFDEAGRPVAWAGEHRGDVPLQVRRGDRAYVFQEGPLFSYIYFVRPIDGGGQAVAAVLLEGDLAIGENTRPFAEDFADRHGLLPRFTLPSRALGDAIWDWSTDVPILSVSFATLTQQRWWERVVHRGLLFVGFLWILSLALLSFAWYRVRAGPPGVPVAIGTLGLLLVPLARAIGNQAWFSPLRFVLPIAGDISLGLFIIVLIGLAIWVLIRIDRIIPKRRISPRIAVIAMVLAFPAGFALMRRSAAAGLFAEEIGGGFGLQFATTLLLTIPLYLLLTFAPSIRGGEKRFYSPLLAIFVAVILGSILMWWWNPGRPIPLWIPALWAIPFAILVLAPRASRDSRNSLGIWLLAAMLAGSATLPYFWLLHMDARLASAERELARLGTEADPFLDFLLRQFAERAQDYAVQGEEGVNLLYHSWVASGLAEEGYEAYLTSWVDGELTAELRLTDVNRPPDRLAELVAEHSTAGEAVVRRFTTLEALHYLLLVPLPDRTIAVAVPPRSQLGRSTALARFLRPESGAERHTPVENLFLVPAPEDAELTPASDSMVAWIPTAAGWRSEARVRFPSGWMHAHLVVRTSSVPLRLVRMLLVLTALLAVMAILWITARALAGQLRISASQLRLIRSFRGRLTLALFAFFLVPTAIFGAVTYGAVSNEVVRSAAVLARRTLEDAVDSARGLASGSPSQEDLLLYRRGTLVGSTAPEVLDLGLFHTWLPPRIHLQFSTGEDLEALEERQLGSSDYLIAYRRLNPTAVVAAPVPLASDEITRRQREFAYVTALMVLLGLALSLVLSLFVGRALARPLDEMSRAAARVGSGNLQLRLPEERLDEFGSVYRSFNAMVRRLRSARAAEIRSARVLAWGEMARQVAHEIKNPLTPIKLSVQHLRRAYADGRADFDAILDRNVDAILKEIDSLGEISRAFSRFGSPAAIGGPPVPIHVDRVVEETIALYRSGRSEIEFTVSADPGLPQAYTQAGELKEVLINLLENARDALGGLRGTVEIGLSVTDDRRWLQIEVSDTGEGIPADLLAQIFEPHFSTRTSGTGLGLAIVRRLVESWGGEVSARSQPGEGTVVRLRLRAA